MATLSGSKQTCSTCKWGHVLEAKLDGRMQVLDYYRCELKGTPEDRWRYRAKHLECDIGKYESK